MLNNVHPNLILTIVLAWSFLKDWPDALNRAFIGGLLMDTYSGRPYGLFTVTLVTASLMANFWRNRRIANTVLPILLIIPYTWLFSLLNLLFFRLIGYSVPWRNLLLDIIFPESLLNVVTMAFIFPLALWFHKASLKDTLHF